MAPDSGLNNSHDSSIGRHYSWHQQFIIIEPLDPQCQKTYLRTWALSEDSDQQRIPLHWSESSLCKHFGIAMIQNFLMRTTKTQIRLRGCAVWSESLLFAHDRKFVFHTADTYHTVELSVANIKMNGNLVSGWKVTVSNMAVFSHKWNVIPLSKRK